MEENEQDGLTYAASGVDIDAEVDSIKALVGQLVFKREGPGAPADLPGHFTGLIDLGETYLSLCTAGVGSKLMIADVVKKWDTIGIDCIAMNVNDMICIGAEPLAMVDYIAIDEPTPELMSEIGKGLNDGAEISNISIIGGETASLPDIVKGFDLVGCCLGQVKKEGLVDGAEVSEGDVIIGIPSSGVHSNGFSLVRKAVDSSNYDYSTMFGEICKDIGIAEDADFLDLSLGEVCLLPTRIYVKAIIDLLVAFKPKGFVHVTGGGLMNLPRLNSSVDYLIEDPLPVLPIFKVIKELGGISDKEMHRTFNMGMGFCLICSPDDREGILSRLAKYEPNAQVVGKIVAGTGIARHIPLDLEFGSL